MTIHELKQIVMPTVRRMEGEYQDKFFRYLMACRDYPFAYHSPPDFPWQFTKLHAEQLRLQWLQEFRRSNPGFELP